jgi:hypothetical protein
MAKTMHDYFFERLNCRYFQAIFDPLVVIQCPEHLDSKNLGETSFPTQNVLTGATYWVSFNTGSSYREIPKDRVEQIKEDFKKGLINKIEEDQFKDLKSNRPTPENYKNLKKNKANLSANTGTGQAPIF